MNQNPPESDATETHPFHFAVFIAVPYARVCKNQHIIMRCMSSDARLSSSFRIG